MRLFLVLPHMIFFSFSKNSNSHPPPWIGPQKLFSPILNQLPFIWSRWILICIFFLSFPIGVFFWYFTKIHPLPPWTVPSKLLTPILEQLLVSWSLSNLLCVLFLFFTMCFFLIFQKFICLPSCIPNPRNLFPRFQTNLHSSDHDETCYESSRPSPYFLFVCGLIRIGNHRLHS